MVSTTQSEVTSISTNNVYIPQIDGKDLWISNFSGKNPNGYTLLNKKGEQNIKRYRATFDYSLDLMKLREIYYKIYRNNKFTFFGNDSHIPKEFCSRIINVTFEYSIKEFNRVGANIYLRIGTASPSVNWRGRVGYQGDDIVAIKTDVEFDSNTHSGEQLEKITIKAFEELGCFIFEKGVFKVKNGIKTMRNVGEVRTDLYKNGFFCDGVKYVRWKRSSGSARVGKCLFIDENLFSRMRRWELCGLNIRNGDSVDLAAIESYISLTSSSIIDTLQISPKNILVIDDYESVFFENVINVTEIDGELSANPELTKISNSIWDGQSLIDSSTMGLYKNKGMLLLRNRFFKSCCFNTNIQLWFKDNGITEIGQLNGFTLAKNIGDIKLITTPNSIKYLKFDSLEKWLSLTDDAFGIVKYDKPTHFMDGKLVQTHYQLINSIQMSKTEVKNLLQPTFDLMTLIKNEPAALRYWIKFNIEDEIEITPLKSKTDVIYKMMSVNSDFCKTKLYYDFKTDFLKSFTKNIKCGRIYVNGNYSTLCGNPIEMLKSAISIFDGNSIIEKCTVYSQRFKSGEDLLGSRSPHPAISNVLLVKNYHYDLIDKYMNSTNEIIYINSIGENILQQLAGSDFDSDQILLTNNDTLITAAKRNDGKFKVAVCNVDGIKRKRKFTNSDKADLDIKTSNNLIGDIINLAQEITSEIWDKLYHGATFDDIFELYLETCKLSILSGIEIDKAKKEFLIDSAKELSIIRTERKKKKINNKSIKPKFFSHIAKQKGYYNPNKKVYISQHTSMDYLQKCVNSFRSRKSGKPQKAEFVEFSDVVCKDDFCYKNVNDRQISDVLKSIDNQKTKNAAIYSNMSTTKSEKYTTSSNIRQDSINSLGNMKFNKDTMIALLQTIEKEENRKYRRLLFYALFGYPNTSFYDVIKQNCSVIDVIVKDKFSDDILIFGEKFAKNIQKQPENLTN